MVGEVGKLHLQGREHIYHIIPKVCDGRVVNAQPQNGFGRMGRTTGILLPALSFSPNTPMLSGYGH